MNQKDCCLICNDTNSSVGWHCGTIACEACKKFFQRNNFYGQFKELKCINDAKNCVITVLTRTNCSYCRFQKCIQAGMKINCEQEKGSDSIDFKRIPCKVCGNPSSGLHYGVVTCEGCKGFFRRNSNEINKLKCVSHLKCEITNEPNRNLCRSCRLEKCINVGMNLQKSKIGRQSNLFKEKLKHQSNLPTRNDEIMNCIQMKHQLPKPQSLQLNSNLNLEEKLDPSTCNLIKLIYSSYVKAFENTTTQFFSYDESYLINFKKHNLVGKFINSQINRCISFLDKIPIYKLLDKKHKLNLISNGIHSLRLLLLANNSLPNLNYLNVDTQTYEEISEIFPIFKEKMIYFETFRQFFQSFKLDSKELALYSALVIFSSVGQGCGMMLDFFGLNLDICRALTNYMSARRNETESAEMLIQNMYRIERLNTHLQKEIYTIFKDLEKYGFLPNSISHLIIFNPFESMEAIFNEFNV